MYIYKMYIYLYNYNILFLMFLFRKRVFCISPPAHSSGWIKCLTTNPLGWNICATWTSPGNAVHLEVQIQRWVSPFQRSIGRQAFIPGEGNPSQQPSLGLKKQSRCRVTLFCPEPEPTPVIPSAISCAESAIVSPEIFPLGLFLPLANLRHPLLCFTLFQHPACLDCNLKTTGQVGSLGSMTSIIHCPWIYREEWLAWDMDMAYGMWRKHKDVDGAHQRYIVYLPRCCPIVS